MRTLIERFWEKVNKSDECWLWTGATYRMGGHGVIGLNGRPVGAHRVSWMLCRGDIPDGLEVCHRCYNPPCVNPDHLFLGTHLDNMRDRDAKGRLVTPRGAHESAKTHCPAGHPYDEANTYRKPRSGKRGCRACHRQRAERQRRADGREKGARKGRYSGMSACTQGHEYTPENTRQTGEQRHCRTCQREYMRERRANGH